MSKADRSTSRRVVTVEGALLSIQGALDHARQAGIAICVSVVDSGGTLAGFARMPEAFLMSGEIAIHKATCVVRAGGLPADTVESVLAPEAPRVREGILMSGYSFIRGGLPLREGECVVGAIGVSGGSEAQDIECAQAGVAAFNG